MTEACSLPRRFGAWTGGAIVVGIIIGSGIFRVPGDVAAATGSAAGVACVWIFGGIVSLCGALSFAELAAMFPRSGGPYVYLLEAYGRPLAFLAGWTWLITTPIAWAAMSLTFAEYLATFVAMGRTMTHLVAAALIALFGAAQYRSVRIGVWLQNVSSVAKIVAILGLATAIFALSSSGSATDATHSAGVSLLAGPIRWGGVGAGLVAALWAYDGWENLTTLAGEIRNPGRSLPGALIGGSVVVMAVYLLLNAAYLRALPFATLARSTAVAADSATAVLGHAGAALGAALVMLSIVGSLNASIMSDTRVLFAMARDGLFFRPAGWVHPRFETPGVAIVFLVAIALVLVMLRSFLALAQSYVLGVWPLLALAVIGVYILRRTRPHAPRPYRTIGYPVVPAIFVLGSCGIIGVSLYEKPLSTSCSVGVTLIGLPLYWLWTCGPKKRAPAAQES